MTPVLLLSYYETSGPAILSTIGFIQTVIDTSILKYVTALTYPYG